ncbi:MAG: 30S ribosomal protein S1, partial [Deltaproteobacteria bacterium]|nr:30S ribosomal protein S1 [Deltaproteobacteria bacterium]
RRVSGPNPEAAPTEPTADGVAEAAPAEADVADAAAAPEAPDAPEVVEQVSAPAAPTFTLTETEVDPAEVAVPISRPERPQRLTPDQAAAKVAAEMSADMEELMAGGAGMNDVSPGDRVRGTVMGVVGEHVLLDVGAKSEGFIPSRELMGPDGLKVEVGQEIEAQVVAVEADGIHLSVGAVRAHQLSEQLESAAANNIPIKGTVVGYNKGGLEVKLGSRRAFCPASQVDRNFSEDLSHHVGQSYSFLITRYDPTGRRIVVSRRAFLETEAKELAAQTRQLLETGAILAGTVRKVTEFGAFVDLGGIDGLVHVSEISWERVEKPSDVLSEGQAVRVKVLKIDSQRDRIGLSIRQAEGDPWAEVGKTFEPGGTYTGRVTRLADFGAFVELATGLEGLVHVSEIEWKRINRPSDALEVGQEVTVKLLEVDKKRKRLALSIKQSTGEDPWATTVSELVPGSEVEVTVEKVAEFGVFCTIADGVTGLMPSSMTNTPRGTNLKRAFRVGQTIKVFVHEVDKRKRKVTLTRSQQTEGGTADYKAYVKEQKKSEDQGFSALAMALQDAFKTD